MTTPVVRTAVSGAVTTAAPALLVKDLSQYVSLSDIGSNLTDVVLLMQFIGGSDDMIDIAGEGNQGWEERGSVALHYMIPNGFDYVPHLATMESLRTALRGRRLANGVVVESITPFTDQISNAERINGGWHGWISYLAYTRYVCG